MKLEKSIRYVNKDFTSIKQQLIEYAKNYFPDSYGDFSATSPGMMFIEMAAYVGDILSFYQDTQIQETFLQYAKNPSNLYNLAYMMGYRPKVVSAATVKLTLSQVIGAKKEGDVFIPDWDEASRVPEGAIFQSTDYTRTNFITRLPVDFRFSSSYNPTDTQVYSVTPDGNPESYILTKTVEAYSGEIRTAVRSFGSYQKYPTVAIEDTGIVGVLSVFEGTNAADENESNVWTEVPCLGQDTVFVPRQSTEDDPTAQYELKVKKVPKRFVTRFRSTGVLELQFGAGVKDSSDVAELLPDPLNIHAPLSTWAADRYDTAYDPSNFLFSDSYGLVPIDTTLYINYIVSSGTSANVAAGTITVPFSGVPEGVSCINLEAASGGRSGDTLDEVRQNALRSFAEQKRAVTLSDFVTRALAMPPEYGVISKAHAVRKLLQNVPSMFSNNPLAVTLYVLSEDIEGKLNTASDVVKENLKTYMSEYLMLTDALEIQDAYVVNIGVKYDIVMKPGYSSVDVLTRCSSVIADYLSTSKRSINEPINLSEMYTLLSGVVGVQVVRNIEITNKVGEDGDYTYSKYAYDVKEATVDYFVYPSYDPCIFELKYPNRDIEGKIVSL